MAELRSVRGAEDEQRVHAGYREVHHAYARLASSPEHGTEALKRAVFIQWFALAEPPFLSGIHDLDEEVTREVLVELEHRVAAAQADAELLGMLAWYFRIADFAFGSPQAFPQLHQTAARLQVDPPQVQRPLAENRGQMGCYWNSLGTSRLP